MAEDYLVEERVATMVSPTTGKTHEKVARFLKPPTNCIDGASRMPFTLSFRNGPEFPPKVLFNGWKCPQKKWKQWVLKLIPECGLTWKRAGIYDAIMASTYEIRKDHAVIFALAECWCRETNTFFFPWGEGTMTLEDIFFLGGFSILGEPVRTKNLTGELAEMEEKISLEHKKFSKHKCHKAGHSAWINHFIERESDNLVHVAFLALWLSRYVFASHPYEVVAPRVFGIAVRLAQGTRIALAPAVLASIYIDLRLLNSLEPSKDTKVLAPVVWAPFQILLLWAWERFSELQPKTGPNYLCGNEPMAARWHKLNSNLKIEFVRSVLKLARNFKWRPYLDNWRCPLSHEKKGKWVYDSMIKQDEQLSSFARCLRASELVGLDCIEQYLPHRVARQFGFDQDLPDNIVSRAEVNWEIAWQTYYKPLNQVKFYVPPRLCELDVTLRFLDWWNHSKSAGSVTTRDNLAQERILTKPERVPEYQKIWMMSSAPPGFPAKVMKRKLQAEWDEDHLTLSESSKLRKGLVSATKRPIQIEQQVERITVTEVSKMKKLGESPNDPLNIEDDEGERRGRGSQKPVLDGLIDKLKKEIAELQTKVFVLKKS